MTPHLEASPPVYVPRDPSQTVLYRVVADHLETFLVSLDADPDAKGLPAYVERELYDYLQCGILAHGFVRPHRLRLWRRGRDPNTRRSPLCQRPRVFPPRQHPGPGPSARSVGAPDPVYRPRHGVPGAPDPTIAPARVRPGSLRLVLCLTAPRASPTRLRPTRPGAVSSPLWGRSPRWNGNTKPNAPRRAERLPKPVAAPAAAHG
jgi:hypothetical protein